MKHRKLTDVFLRRRKKYIYSGKNVKGILQKLHTMLHTLLIITGASGICVCFFNDGVVSELCRFLIVIVIEYEYMNGASHST